MEVFVSREIWKVHVFPAAAGQVTGIGANIEALARQPVVPHWAVAGFLLTTKVVLTRVSLLIIVWAVRVGVAKNDSAIKANAAIPSNRCGDLICAGLREDLVERASGPDSTMKLAESLQGSDARMRVCTFFTKAPTFIYLNWGKAVIVIPAQRFPDDN